MQPPLGASLTRNHSLHEEEKILPRRRDREPPKPELDDSELSVSPLYPLHLLKMTYIKNHSFCGLSDEAQMAELMGKQRLSHYRQIPLDGNCFYRAAYYCVMELVLLDPV